MNSIIAATSWQWQRARSTNKRYGVPAEAQQSGFGGERRSKGAARAFRFSGKRRSADFVTTRQRARSTNNQQKSRTCGKRPGIFFIEKQISGQVIDFPKNHSQTVHRKNIIPQKFWGILLVKQRVLPSPMRFLPPKTHTAKRTASGGPFCAISL